jgi:hypothetical protein
MQARALGVTGLTMFERYEFVSRLRQAGFTEVAETARHSLFGTPVTAYRAVSPDA